MIDETMREKEKKELEREREREREKRALCLGKKEEEMVFVMFVSFLCVI